MTKQQPLRKIVEWIIIYCQNIAGGNLPYFPLPGPKHLKNLIPKCKILSVFWIARKRRIEEFNFSFGF